MNEYMKKLTCMIFTFFLITSNVYASYIQDLDYSMPEQLMKIQKWKYINCIGGSYEFIPTIYEWILWGYNPDDYSNLTSEDAITTKHNEVNSWEVSYADRFCKYMYNFYDYNLVSFISMYNELIPYYQVSYGDENLKFNYPFDIREYSWEDLEFNDIDWNNQENWLKIRKYLSNNKKFIDIKNLDIKNLSIKDEEEIRQFLYKTNIPKTITMCNNNLPNIWCLPSSPYDFGLIGRISKNDTNNFYYSLVPEIRKDYSYSHKSQENNKNIWKNQPYDMWRYASYASRWHFADIINMIAGELNMRFGKKEDEVYPYNKIPNYFWENNNIIIPIKESKDKKDGINKIYKYCLIMDCAKYNYPPNVTQVNIIYKYSKDILEVLGYPYKFLSSMAEESQTIRKIISEKEKIYIDDSTWYYTLSYLINSQGLSSYK